MKKKLALFPEIPNPQRPLHLAVDSLFFTVVGVRFSSRKSAAFSFWLPACHYHHPGQPRPPHCQASSVPQNKLEPNEFFPRELSVAEWPRRLPIGEFFHLVFASLSANALSLELILFTVTFQALPDSWLLNSQGTIVERALF